MDFFTPLNGLTTSSQSNYYICHSKNHRSNSGDDKGVLLLLFFFYKYGKDTAANGCDFYLCHFLIFFLKGTCCFWEVGGEDSAECAEVSAPAISV